MKWLNDSPHSTNRNSENNCQLFSWRRCWGEGVHSFAHSTITFPLIVSLFLGDRRLHDNCRRCNFERRHSKCTLLCVCSSEFWELCKLQNRARICAPFALLLRENKINSFLATAVNIVCLLMGLPSIFNKSHQARRFLQSQRDWRKSCFAVVGRQRK